MKISPVSPPPDQIDGPLASSVRAEMLRAKIERFLASILGNGMVVPAGRWPETRLSPGDELEIVRPFSGG